MLDCVAQPFPGRGPSDVDDVSVVLQVYPLARLSAVLPMGLGLGLGL